MKTKKLYICLMALFSITAFAGGFDEYGGSSGGGSYGGNNPGAGYGGSNGAGLISNSGLYGTTGVYGSNNTGGGTNNGGSASNGGVGTTPAYYVNPYNQNGKNDLIDLIIIVPKPYVYNPPSYSTALAGLNQGYSPGYNSPGGGNTGSTNNSPSSPTPLIQWYYDKDGDGYHSSVILASVAPYTLFKANTLGLDCDDNNGLKTNNCDPTDPHITNVVNDPCIKSAVSKVISGSATNQFTQILNGDFYKEDYQSLTFTEYSDGSVEGIKVDGELIPGNKFNQNIRLNLAALDNASQEYMVATIYHEIIHAQLRSQGIPDIGQHEIIATSWRQKISDQLRIDFPNLSQRDADGLAWGGLGETPQWQTMVNNDRSNNTGITGAIQAVNDNHKNLNNSTNGHYGTPCTN
jgi:hypothetical protein